jgi:hypothetical protein
MCHTVWQQHLPCQFNSRHLYLLSVLSQQHFMQSCHDLHIHLRSDLKAFSFLSSVHWDLSSCKVSHLFISDRYQNRFMTVWGMTMHRLFDDRRPYILIDVKTNLWRVFMCKEALLIWFLLNMLSHMNYICIHFDNCLLLSRFSVSS